MQSVVVFYMCTTYVHTYVHTYVGTCTFSGLYAQHMYVRVHVLAVHSHGYISVYTNCNCMGTLLLLP